NPQGQVSAGAPIESWEDDKIKAMIPALAGNTTYGVEVQTSSGAKSNRINFLVRRGQPRIDQIEAAAVGPDGTTLGLDNDFQYTIKGSEFGKIWGRLNLFQGTKEVDKFKIVSWSDNQIVFSISPRTT